MAVKKGDLFYTSWGYDQTNYDYILVLEISKTGKTAICQMAKADNVGYSGQAYIQKPKPEGYGDKFRMRIERYNGEIHLRGSYPFIHTGKLEDGKRLDTFWKTDGKETFYETDTMFGH